MVAYSFRKRFAAPIVAGVKRQTIRDQRKRHARPGETLQLYTGMRTRSCRLIGTAICQSTSPITLDFAGDLVRYEFGPGVTTVYPGGLDAFAVGDGFADWKEMREFWAQEHAGQLVFEGWLIRWMEFTDT